MRRRAVERRFAEPQIGTVHRSRSELHQVHSVAGEQRKLLDASRIDHLSDGNFGGREKRRLRRDRDFFLGIAHLQLQVDFRSFADADLNIVLCCAFETGRDRDQAVSTGRKKRRREIPALVGSQVQYDAGSIVQHFDASSGDGRARVIDDAPSDGSARVLRIGGGRQEGKKNC